jgi:hypothetical protein
MPSRQARSLPSLFLMTDERMGDALWRALERLPRGAGVVFRHYRLPPVERRALFERVRAVARRRGLRLLLGGPERLARGPTACMAPLLTVFRRGRCCAQPLRTIGRRGSQGAGGDATCCSSRRSSRPARIRPRLRWAWRAQG